MDQICTIWPANKISLEMLPFHFHRYGIFAFDLRRSCPYCSTALSLPLTHLNGSIECHDNYRLNCKEDAKRTNFKIPNLMSSILYRMFNRSSDGKGVIIRNALYSSSTPEFQWILCIRLQRQPLLRCLWSLGQVLHHRHVHERRVSLLKQLRLATLSKAFLYSVSDA